MNTERLNTTLSTCAQACQDEILLNFSCNIDSISTNIKQDPECFCSARSPVYHALTSCLQASCKLEEVLQWQKMRAQTCDIQPRDIRYAILVSCCVLFGVVSVSCVGRLLSRSKHLGGPGFWWDDWTVLVLYIMSTEMIVDVIQQHNFKSGVDVIAATVEDIYGVGLWCYISTPFYLCGTYGSKLVFSLLYLRMWNIPGMIRNACWLMVFLSIIGLTAVPLACGLVRWPWWYYYGDSAIVRNWVLGIYVPAAVYGFAAINILADFYVLLLPIPMLRHLKGLTRNRKISISVTFLVGFVATAASVVRLATIPPLTNSLNATWDLGLFMLACQVEVHVSMICMNMPTWTGLLRRSWRGLHRGRGKTPLGTNEIYDFPALSGDTLGRAGRSPSDSEQSKKGHSPQGRELELSDNDGDEHIMERARRVGV